MLERALEDVRHDFHVAMRMGAEALAGLDAVLVDDAEGPEPHLTWVVVVAERECVAGIEPPMVGPAAFVGRSNGEHECVLSGIGGYVIKADT
jgi:hypothetical protein